MRKLLLTCVVMSMLSGCANPHIGKKLNFHPYDEWFNEKTGHHDATLTHIILDYDYRIEGGRIYFDGIITCNPDETIPWDNATIDLKLYFMDKGRTILTYNHFSPMDTVDFCEPKPFVTDYPFPEDGMIGVRYDYRVNMWQ